MRTNPQGPRPRAALADMARKSLTRWAANYAQRDEVVRLAAASGLGVNEITRITGLAKTTVIRILRTVDDAERQGAGGA